MEERSESAFERVQRARHPARPYALDIFESVFEDFVEIHGDRRYADDSAIVSGFARLNGAEVAVIGHQKGRDTNQRRHRNFGMPKPEGYRKALRVMRLAEKFGRPIVTFIDTPGAYPGIDAEERGQAEAIAFNLREMAQLKVPTIIVVLGEGGSGGALAIGIGDRVLMCENAVYSVISPEGCAAILFKDAAEAEKAANSLKLTALDLRRLELIDEIVPEASDWEVSDEEEDQSFADDPVTKELKRSIEKHLKQLSVLSTEELLEKRFEKFRAMGKWLGA
ncbi:MAG: acetyl-CoA carboxylase carboxyltransferase subunit alpha [Acidobacteria bacterium]|nr:MAG: acetyl-CoA carboxylase carboxyltransferase subunit alpha [Acidobacteriota bacterium]REK01432.1 MAG: acetyl-CoA carboxylase carboxyltransferase subunit alpha [Acidobacteriota bacterium]REK14388.1 MAG: acetyl-CoA carboxylase carboxyltransferase subunit alpha [Acidobacteriota bacterium]REK45103.1 MAG: acetyl-CoA carboxylase carboxyltransferase subunit alpha [Acidobacteriota bacterium]